MLREVTPWGAAVLKPPGWDRNYTEVFGFTLEDIGEEGVTSLQTKLRSAGMPIEELPGPPIVPADLTPRETATRGPLLTQAGLLGERQAVGSEGRGVDRARDGHGAPPAAGHERHEADGAVRVHGRGAVGAADERRDPERRARRMRRRPT